MEQTLIFDIETVGENWTSLDKETKDSLLRWVRRTARSEAEEQRLTTDVINGLGFSPFTGFVVAIGLYDLKREAGVVYYQGEGKGEEIEVDGYLLKERTEKAMLEDFWEGVKSYNTFVTFNGRSFDVPFLLHRSVVCGVVPTKNLLEGRYPYQQKTCRHVDLLDELTFFGAMARKPTLHLVCRAYGIASPKGEVSGDDVAELFSRKKFRDIAIYNAKDVTATKQVYSLWSHYLNFTPSSKDIDF